MPATDSVAVIAKEIKLAEKDLVRFWSKIDKEGEIQEHTPHLGPCWKWIGTRDSDGYGVFKVRNPSPTMFKAHRISAFLHLGTQPIGVTMHKCDNRACVNPEHLQQGNPTENVWDRDRKGRCARGPKKNRETIKRGSEIGTSKLTDERVIQLKSMAAEGNLDFRELAKDWGMNIKHLSRVARGRLWKHISITSEPPPAP